MVIEALDPVGGGIHRWNGGFPASVAAGARLASLKSDLAVRTDPCGSPWVPGVLPWSVSAVRRGFGLVTSTCVTSLWSVWLVGEKCTNKPMSERHSAPQLTQFKVLVVAGMAGKATKKQAQSNLAVLSGLYKVSLPIVALAMVRQGLAGSTFSQWLRFAVLHVPLAGCMYVLEKSGRPVFDAKGKIVKEGTDLSQAGGLVEYMFDLIYLSLFADVGQALFNTAKLWYVLVLIPIYAGWKLYGLKNQFLGPRGPTGGSSGEEPTANGDSKSKRQIKREKRGNKAQVKYR